METEHGQATTYKGNYTEYVNAKAEKVAQQWAAYEKQQKEIARQVMLTIVPHPFSNDSVVSLTTSPCSTEKVKEQSVLRLTSQRVIVLISNICNWLLTRQCYFLLQTEIIHRLSGGAQAGRAAAAEKALEKIKSDEGLITKPFVPKKRSFAFPSPERMGQRVLEINGLTHGYGDRRLFDNVDLEIEKGERVAIIGALLHAFAATVCRIAAWLTQHGCLGCKACQ